MVCFDCFDLARAGGNNVFWNYCYVHVAITVRRMGQALLFSVCFCIGLVLSVCVLCLYYFHFMLGATEYGHLIITNIVFPPK